MIDWYDTVFSLDSNIVREVKRKKPRIDIRYLPLGFNPNPEWENITEADRRRFECDVGFVGYVESIFTEREQLLKAVVDAGINIKIFSRSDTKQTSIADHCFGPLTDEELGKFYRIAKICLNDEFEPRGSGLVLRTFEISSAGGFQLSGLQEDLPDMFIPDKEIVVFRTKEEAIEKIRHYLAHPEERKAIAEAGLVRARRDHTMTVRLIQFLVQVKTKTK
jgi:spore maturation protein CgeB